MQIFKEIKSRSKRVFLLLKLGWLWGLLRPTQLKISKLIFRKGIKKSFGDIDRIYLCYDCWDADMPAAWEINWWRRLTQEIRPQDTIVDVGAYIGILTIIMARKAGRSGKVVAFEPNPKSLKLFKKNIKLNEVAEQVEFFDLAVGQDSRELALVGQGSITRVIPAATPGGGSYLSVKSAALDEILGNRKIDLMKIDVEGYEASVLYGAKNLLSKKETSPRFMLIECHPHFWKELGVSSKDISAFLEEAGYLIEMPNLQGNQELDSLKHHWVIFAAKKISA